MITSRIDDPTIALSMAINDLQSSINDLEKVNCLSSYLKEESNDLQILNRALPECKQGIDTLSSLNINAFSPELIATITLIITAIDESAGSQLTKNLAWTLLQRNKLTYCRNFLNNWVAQLNQFQIILSSWTNLSPSDREAKPFPKIDRLRTFIDKARNKATSNHLVSSELDDLLQSVITAFNNWKPKEVLAIADTSLTKSKKNAWLNRGHFIGGATGLGVCTTLAITYPPAACALWGLYALCILGAVISSWAAGAIVKYYRASADNKAKVNTNGVTATHLSSEQSVSLKLGPTPSSSFRNLRRVSPTPEDDNIPAATGFNFGHIIGAMIGVVVFLAVLAPCLPTTLAEYCIYGLYLAAPIILGALGVGSAVNYCSDSDQNEDEDGVWDSDEKQAAIKDRVDRSRYGTKGIDGRRRSLDDSSPVHSPRSTGRQGSFTNLSNGDHKGSLPSPALAFDDQPASPSQLSRQSSKSDLQRVSSFSRAPSQGVGSESNSRTHSRTPSG